MQSDIGSFTPDNQLENCKLTQSNLSFILGDVPATKVSILGEALASGNYEILTPGILRPAKCEEMHPHFNTLYLRRIGETTYTKATDFVNQKSDAATDTSGETDTSGH